MALKFHTSVKKGLKLKVRQFVGLVPTFVEVTGEKMVGEDLSALPPERSWIGLKQSVSWKREFPFYWIQCY